MGERNSVRHTTSGFHSAFLLIIFAIYFAYSQSQKENIAVITVSGSISESEAIIMTDKLISELMKGRKFTVIERSFLPEKVEYSQEGLSQAAYDDSFDKSQDNYIRGWVFTGTAVALAPVSVFLFLKKVKSSSSRKSKLKLFSASVSAQSLCQVHFNDKILHSDINFSSLYLPLCSRQG